MVMKYNQFKPLFGEIAGGFPFAGKPLGWVVSGAGLAAVGRCGGGVVLLGWLGVRGYRLRIVCYWCVFIRQVLGLSE